ncbi:MAG: TerB family tellurite resistance protein [Cyclobacteriaceae bacterium]
MQLARIDGDTSESEIKLIREIAKSSYVSDEALREIQSMASKENTIPSVEALSYEERVELLTNLVLVMRVDGRIELREMDFCLDVVKKIGFSETQFFNLVVGVFDERSPLEADKIREYVESGLDKV